VKARALVLGVPVFTPHRIRRDLPCQRQLAELGADVSVVVAFGQILPPEVLRQPPLGCWNGHGSLLPRWRGAAPIQWALLSGDRETGVGIMAMEEGLDTGPVLLERRLPIGLLENAEHLAQRLASLTGELLVEAMDRVRTVGAGEESDRLERLGVRPQAKEGVTYARLLTKSDLIIDWTLSALEIHRRVMGLYPGATTHWRGLRLKLHHTEPLLSGLEDQLSPEAAGLIPLWGGRAHGASPGTILGRAQGLGLVVASGREESLLLRSAQLEGRTVADGDRLWQQLGAAVWDGFESLSPRNG
jgi:methionyl-tRNA formyltransferase